MQSYLSLERGRKVSKANWKKLRRSPASYKKVKIDCLATNVGSESQEEIQR